MPGQRKKVVIGMLVVLSLFLAGCGQTLTQSIAPATQNSVEKKGSMGRIIVLPFADYTQGQSPDDYLRRYVKLTEAISYNCLRQGYLGPMEEDVVQVLIDMGIVRVVHRSSRGEYTRALEQEMERGWSDVIQAEVWRHVKENEVGSGEQDSWEMTRVGLGQDVVRELGRRFDAQYVLRGRIVEYEMRDEHTLDPLKRGLLPFFFDSTSATIFGVAKSDKYDLWQDLAVGGGVGALIGSGVNEPFNPPHKDTVTSGGPHPAFITVSTVEHGGHSDYSELNTAVWGTAGAAAAYLAKQGGGRPQAVVQVYMAAQDATSGQVIWANRAEVQVAAKTAFADPQARTLMDRAVEEAARVLVDDFALRVPRMAFARFTGGTGEAAGDAPASVHWAGFRGGADEGAGSVEEPAPESPELSEQPSGDSDDPASWGS